MVAAARLPGTSRCVGSDVKTIAPVRSSRTSRALGLHASASPSRTLPNASASRYVTSRRSIARIDAVSSTWIDPAGRCRLEIEGPPSSASNRPDRQHSVAVVCERKIGMVAS